MKWWKNGSKFTPHQYTDSSEKNVKFQAKAINFTQTFLLKWVEWDAQISRRLVSFHPISEIFLQNDLIFYAQTKTVTEKCSYFNCK